MREEQWSMYMVVGLFVVLVILVIIIVTSDQNNNFTEDYNIDGLPPYDPRLVSLVENTEDAKYSILILSNCTLNNCTLINSKNKLYAERQGYDIETINIQDSKKYNIILREMEKNNTVDYILYINNSIINRSECSLEELIKVAGTANIIITRGDKNNILDENVILIRNSLKSRNIIASLKDNTLLSHLDSDFISSGFNKSGSTLLFNAFKNCLDNGYPVRTRNFLIFTNNVFSGSNATNFIINVKNNVNILKEQSSNTLVYPWNQSRIKTIPRYIPARVDSVTQGKIPKIIYQTFTTVAVPTEIHNAVMSWVMENKDYEYYFYDDADCEEYIEKEFPSALESFRNIIPGAYKADLFRYCIIYNNGGYYADVKSICRTAIRDMPDYRTDKKEPNMIITLDRDRRELYNAFFASVPKNPILLETVNSCIQMITEKNYGSSPLDITGPTRFGKIFYNNIDSRELLSPGTIYLDNIDRIEIFEHSVKDPKSVIDKNGRIITTTRCTIKSIVERNESDYLFNITGKGHYGYYWNKRLVYNI